MTGILFYELKYQCEDFVDFIAQTSNTRARVKCLKIDAGAMVSHWVPWVTSSSMCDDVIMEISQFS